MLVSHIGFSQEKPKEDINFEDISCESYVPIGDLIYTTAEVLPEYPKGLDKLNEFFKENFKNFNLKSSLKGRFKGRVILQFIVEKDGSLSDIKVLRDLGYETGKEAVRLLKLAGKWNAGLQNGEIVRVRYILPVPVDIEVK